VTDFRLHVHLAVLSTALEDYLLQLRRRWNAPAPDDLDAEISRLLVGVGTGPSPTEGDLERVAELLAVPAEGALSRI